MALDENFVVHYCRYVLRAMLKEMCDQLSPRLAKKKSTME